jgi:glycosidase
MNYSLLRGLFVSLAFVLLVPARLQATLATAWHIPDNTNDLGVTMRNPEFEIGASNIVAVYSGVQKFNNPYGTANQTGGTLYYKGLSQGVWNSTNLQFYLNGGPSPNNQYWRAFLNSAAVGTNEVIQYYLYLTFDSGAENTYLYAPTGKGDSGGATTTSESSAASSPFTIRNRAAWLYHVNNRVIDPGADANTRNVEFWMKGGYIGKDSTLSSRWFDHACVYYTTNGSPPSGALGFPSNSTQVALMALDHIDSDQSIAGNAMWWTATASNLPTFTTIQYRIGAWHSSNSEEKFADYKASGNNVTFNFSIGTAGDPVLTINGLNADYTTTHTFVDELAGDSNPLNIVFSPNASNLTAVEVFSNMNRRDRASVDANVDGIEDGIVPPDGNNIVAGDDSNYYKAYAMAPTGQAGQYALTLNAQKTGAYRLTARYKVSGNTNWFWYSTSPRRAHAIVVSPRKARDIVLYELNTLNVESQGTLDAQRSTFTDLYDGPNSRPYNAVTSRFNLQYLQNLGVNWLWFQPIHPQGIDGRQTDPATGQPYEVGSPYAVKNFYEVMPLMGKDNTRAGAMMEFTNFVAAADSAGLSVMLDAPFNHTAYDCELAASGVHYFSSNALPTDEIRNKEARFYSRTDAYDMRATSAANVAVAPDRYDFGKFGDTHEVYFGRYASLVPNSSQSGNYLNEGDWFDYSVGSENSVGDGNGHFDNITRNTWRYFADYILYWLDKTGCPAGTAANQTYHGIDGLRADFGQGLPPQCWEYIINKARSRKWDFVFMTESLDGGAVTYRSNRHFDILNENIVFALKSAATATDYRNIFEGRRNAYGQGLVLLNSTSHDEESYDDPFQAAIRYLVGGTVDGAPMIFYGQELGLSRTFGFDRFELNFGKQIPNFKKYNSLQPLFAPANRNYGLDQLYPVYASVGQARTFCRALRTSNRYFLDQTGGGGPQPNIYSIAKFEQPNGSPNFYDVVFAFVNLDRNNNQQGNFNVNITQNGANLFGIKSDRNYNVKNIAAYTGIDSARRSAWLIPGNISGATLLNSGLFVSLKKVPTVDAAWSTEPFEAQYLKLYDVTPPPTPAAPFASKPYVIGNAATFSWAAVLDSEGGISGYHLQVGTSPGGSDVFNGNVSETSQSVTNSTGQTLYGRVSALNNAGVEGSFSPNSSGVILLSATADADGDGMSNADEDFAGTNPFDSASALRILSLANGNLLTWTSVSNKTYRVLVATSLSGGFLPLSGVVTASGPSTSYVDSGATDTPRFYRVNLVP